MIKKLWHNKLTVSLLTKLLLFAARRLVNNTATPIDNRLLQAIELSVNHYGELTANPDIDRALEAIKVGVDHFNKLQSEGKDVSNGN